MFILLCLLISPVIARADEQTQNTSKEQTVKITVPDSYYARKFFLFPLDLPSYVVRAATWPLGVGLKAMQDKHVLEKTLNFLSNKDKTFWVYPVIEGGAGDSFGGGVGIRHTNLFHRGYLLAATYKIRINLDQNAAFSFAKPNAISLFGKSLSYSLGANWQRLLSANFFGIGNDSAKNNQSSYRLHDLELLFTLSYEVINNLSILPYIGFIDDEGTNTNNGKSPGVQTMFSPTELYGLSNWLRYIDSGIKITHDTRDKLDYPEHGGLRSFTYHHFFCFNHPDFNYDQFEVDVHQYVSLGRPRQLFAFHTGWVFQNPNGSGKIPFYRLATLDAGTPLRGFVNGRFRDRNSAIVNAEYRFPVWTMIDGVLFYDTGRVYHSLNNISINALKYSVGGGLKLSIPKLALFSVQAGYGGEGINLMFGASRPL